MISQGHGGAFRDVALHHKKALLFPIFCNTLLHQGGGFNLVLVSLSLFPHSWSRLHKRNRPELALSTSIRGGISLE